MSMLATFVQVDPGVLDDPSQVERLFAPELPAAFDPARMREAILERGPQLLSGAMDLPAQLREQIEQSLTAALAAAEPDAAARFDPQRMNLLQIYPFG